MVGRLSQTAQTRAWFFPTSPRSPDVVEEDFRLIKDLDGVYWNKQTQTDFGKRWAASAGGRSTPKDPAFTARDRVTRAPKLLGLITIPPMQTAPIRLTKTGRLYLQLSNKRSLYTKQLLKIQFPSPLHGGNSYDLMDIKPLIAVALILEKAGPLSKEEFQLFVLTTIRSDQINQSVRDIKDFRTKLLGAQAGLPRKKLRKSLAEKRVAQVYKDDIDAGNTYVREGSKKFIQTKLKTLQDYADAAFRYLLATELFTVNPRTNRLTKASMYAEDFDYIVSKLNASAEPCSKETYVNWADNYLGDPSIPSLPSDDVRKTKSKTLDVLARYSKSEKAKTLHQTIMNTDDNSELIILFEQAHDEILRQNLKETSDSIKNNVSHEWQEVKDLYDAISRKDSELIDRPLLYEWNTWRAFEILNDNIAAIPNLKFDLDSNPISTASGKMPDMIIEFSNFWLVVEVTLLSGYKQYEAEGESIIRHVGHVQSEKYLAGDNRPVFGLFIAEKIHDEVVHYLRTNTNLKSRKYGGSVRILPLERRRFIQLLDQFILEKKRSTDFLKALESSFNLAKNTDLDEIEWIDHSFEKMSAIASNQLS